MSSPEARSRPSSERASFFNFEYSINSSARVRCGASLPARLTGASDRRRRSAAHTWQDDGIEIARRRRKTWRFRLPFVQSVADAPEAWGFVVCCCQSAGTGPPPRIETSEKQQQRARKPPICACHADAAHIRADGRSIDAKRDVTLNLRRKTHHPSVAQRHGSVAAPGHRAASKKGGGGGTCSHAGHP